MQLDKDLLSGIAYVTLNSDHTDFIYQEVNDSYHKVLKLRDGAIVENLASQVHPFYPTLIKSVIDSFIQKAKKRFVLKGENGEFYLSVTIYQKEENLSAIRVEDISSIIEEFKQSESIFNLTPALFCVIDTQGEFLLVNNEWTTVLGYERSTLLESGIKDYLHPEDLESTMELIGNLNIDRVVSNFINRYRHIEGSYRYLEWRVKAYGPIVVASARDITERILESRSKQRELDLLSFLFDQSLTGLIVLASDTPVDIELSDEQYSKVLENFKIIRANDAIAKQYRMAKEELLGRSVADFIRFGLDISFSKFNRIIKDPKTSIEYVAKRANGEPFWARGNFSRLLNENGKLIGIYGMQIDINQRKKGEIALTKSENMFRLITENASDVIWKFDVQQNKITYMSPSVESFLGYTPKEMLQHGHGNTIHPDDRESAYLYIRRAIKNKKGDKTPLQIRQITKDQQEVWCEVTTNVRHTKEETIEIIGVGRNITERKKNELKILELSYKDQLTNLYNRNYLEKFQKEISKDNSLLPLSVVICDINGLKLTNDLFGHEKGDRLLKNGSSVFKKVLKEGDVAVRMGGDEFVLIFSNCKNEECAKRVDSMRKLSSNKIIGKIPLSISFGYATTEEPIKSINFLIRKAEEDMYRNKLKESASFKEGVVDLLINSFYEKGIYEKRHSKVVGLLCSEMGKAFNLGQTIVDELKLAGVLHDIGKITLKKEILNKATSLNEEEKVAMMRHPELGYNFLRTIQGFGRVAEWILMHHEQPDGKGYPQQLSDNKIPLEAKIIAVATYYDTITNSVRQQRLKTHSEAAIELKKLSKSKFDEKVVDVFLSLPLARIVSSVDR